MAFPHYVTGSESLPASTLYQESRDKIHEWLPKLVDRADLRCFLDDLSLHLTDARFLCKFPDVDAVFAEWCPPWRRPAPDPPIHAGRAIDDD